MTSLIANGSYTYSYEQSGPKVVFTTSVAGSAKTYTPLTFSGRSSQIGVYALGNAGNHSIVDIDDGGVRYVYGFQGTGAAATILTFDARGSLASALDTLGTVNGRDLIFIDRDYLSVPKSGGGSMTYDLDVFATDGTQAGTVKLFEVDANAVSNLDTLNGRALLITNNGGHFALYSTDGTVKGTDNFLTFDGMSAKVLDHFNGKDVLRTFSQGNASLYVTDGTSAGTHLVYSVATITGVLTHTDAVTTSVTFVDRAAGEDIFSVNINGHDRIIALDPTFSSSHVVYDFYGPSVSSISVMAIKDEGSGHEIVKVTISGGVNYYDLDVVHGGAVQLVGYVPPH